MFGKRSLLHWTPRFVQVATTFLIVCIAWVFFRSPDLSDAWQYMRMLFSFKTPITPIIKLAHAGMWTDTHIICLIAAAAISFWGIQTWDMAKRVGPWTVTFSLLVFWASIATLSVRSYMPFLYFRF